MKRDRDIFPSQSNYPSGAGGNANLNCTVGRCTTFTSSATKSQEYDATMFRRRLFLTFNSVCVSSSSYSFNRDYRNHSNRHQTQSWALVGTSFESPSGQHHTGRFNCASVAPGDVYQWKTFEPSREQIVSTRRI